MNAGWFSFSKTLPEYISERDFVIIKFSFEPETVEKGSDKSSDKIIRLIRENPYISAVKIAKELSITSRAVEKHIALLKIEGKLTRVGHRKGGHWKINAPE